MIASWLRGPGKWARHTSFLSQQGNQVSLPKDNTLASLPEAVLRIIFSYLTCLDRLRLKKAGNIWLASILSDFPKPDFKTYISQLEKCPSRTFPEAKGTERLLCIASENGNEGLFLKILSQNPFHNRHQEAEMIGMSLFSAIYCEQKHMLQLILKRQNSTSPAFFRALPSPGPHGWKVINRKSHLAEAALEFAAQENRLWAVQALLKHGAKASSTQGQQGLFEAARRGHQEVVAMLSKQISSQARPAILTRALAGAIRSGNDRIIQILLAQGAKASYDPGCRGSLHRAAEYGRNSTIEFLVPRVPQDYYVNPQVGRGMGDRLYSYWPGSSQYQRTLFETLVFKNWCCLHFAIYNGHQDTVKLLLENNIIPPGNPEHRATALPLAALRGHAEITKLLIAAGFDTSAILWRFTALELASKYGHTNVITVLLDAGVLPTALDLANAVSSGSISAVSLLLERGADLHSIADRTGDTALHAAVREKNKEMLEFLLNYGANVEIFDGSGKTPLYRALERHNGDAVKMLFEYGAFTESQIGPTGRARIPFAESGVLHYALANRAGDLVPLLLEHGAKVEGRARHGMTPFLHAASCGSVSAVEALHAAGCNIHARDEKQRTALHYAANGHTDAVEVLLGLGLDPNTRDVDGKTPLHLAPSSSISTAYQVLVRHGGDVKAVDHEGHSVGYYQNQSWAANHG